MKKIRLILDHLHVHSKFNEPIKKLLRATLNQSVREVTGTPVQQCSKVNHCNYERILLDLKILKCYINLFSALAIENGSNLVSGLRFAYKI